MTTTQVSVAELCIARSRAVDTQLEEWLPRPPRCPEPLGQAMRYAVFSGGKRLRPVLTLLSCRAAGADESLAMAPACAVELVHCYSLVHDDLPAMDDDDLRRGRPTVHKAFDEATAILAGDALLTLAFEILAQATAGPERIVQWTRELATAAGAAGMVGGQADDMLGVAGLPDLENSTALTHLASVHARKTGALLLASVRLGAMAAGVDAATMAAFDRYGRLAGLAFQIADDLLDVQGDPAKVGKRVRKDQACGKLTYPALLGVEVATRKARETVAEACAALRPLGSAADELCELAHYLVERDL